MGKKEAVATPVESATNAQQITNYALVSRCLTAEIEHLQFLQNRRRTRWITPFVCLRINRQITRVQRLFDLLNC